MQNLWDEVLKDANVMIVLCLGDTSRGIYKLTDWFFRFWHAFAFTHYSDLEDSDVDGVYNCEVEPLLHEYASAAFEDVCRQFVQVQQKKNALPYKAYCRDTAKTGCLTLAVRAFLF